MDIVIHLTRPLQEAPQALALGPQEFPKFQETDLGHFDARKGFDAPEEIGTTPRRNAVAARRIPYKPEHLSHR